MKRIIIVLIRGYQSTISRLFPRVCRFAPSCSSYAIEAVRTYGVFKGSLLSMWRVLKCNPFCAGGWDPVPPKGFRHKDISKGNTICRESRSE